MWSELCQLAQLWSDLPVDQAVLMGKTLQAHVVRFPFPLLDTECSIGCRLGEPCDHWFLARKMIPKYCVPQVGCFSTQGSRGLVCWVTFTGNPFNPPKSRGQNLCSKKALTKSSIVGLDDLPFKMPPLAEVAIHKRSTLLLASSDWNSTHLTSTTAKSSLWHIRWSPTRSFHGLRRSWWTWSWTTSALPEDSWMSAAPRPAFPSSQNPSVKARTVLLSSPSGNPSGFGSCRRATTSYTTPLNGSGVFRLFVPTRKFWNTHISKLCSKSIH